MRNWRVLTWIIVAVNILFAVMLFGGLGAAGENCTGITGDELEMCQAGTAIGATLGATALILLWALVDVILGVVWLVTNNKGRECPACGRKVKRGLTVCKSCGHNFASAPAAAS